MKEGKRCEKYPADEFVRLMKIPKLDNIVGIETMRLIKIIDIPNNIKVTHVFLFYKYLPQNSVLY